MPIIKCPYPDCDFETEDVNNDLACVLLTMHAGAQHPTTTNGSTATPPAPLSAARAAPVRTERVKRPTISMGATTEYWSYFLVRWKDYKEATGITGRDLIIQLLECCEEDLRQDLTRYVGGSLTDKTEDFVLEKIKALAIHEENSMVACVALQEMRQDAGEMIRKFSARVRGQAGVCKLVVKCHSCEAEVSYIEQAMRNVICHGIADPEIQLDLLSDANQDMTLEEVLQFIEKKEAGKRSAGKLLGSQGADHIRSQYKSNRQKNLIERKSDIKTDLCTYCGKAGHGKSAPPNVRKMNCSAFNQTCQNCKKLHHVESVCRNKAKQLAAAETDSQGAIFEGS